MTLDSSKWESKFKIKRIKVKIIAKENVNIVFRAYFPYFHQTWIDSRRTKTKIILGPFYTNRQIHLITSETRNFCDICLFICPIAIA